MPSRTRFCSWTSLAVAPLPLALLCACDGGTPYSPGELDDIELGEDILVEEVAFENASGEPIVGVYLPPERTSPGPAVIVLHGSGGLLKDPDSDDDGPELSSQFEEWAALLHREGYAVLLPASFYSRGFYEWHEAPSELDKEDRLRMRVLDAFAALEFACDQREIDCDRVAVLGFSNGASTAALSAHRRLEEVEILEDVLPSKRPSFALSIPYYPGCGFQGEVSLNMDEPSEFYDPAIPVFVQHAEKDSLLDDCETRLQQTELLVDLEGRSENLFQLRVYDGAGHGFDSSPNGSAEKRARIEARERVLGLLHDLL